MGTVNIAGSRNGEGLGTNLGIFLPCDFTWDAHTSGLFYPTRELRPEKRDSVSSSPVPDPEFHNPCSQLPQVSTLVFLEEGPWDLVSVSSSLAARRVLG